MAKKARQRGFRSGFLGFGKKRKPPAGGAVPVHVLDERAKNDDFRFLVKLLSFQSKYLPKLTKLHNDMLLKPVFHDRRLRPAKNAGLGIPVITGIFSEDARLLLNARKMRLLEEKINKQRELGIKVFRKTGYEAAQIHINKARDFEKQFIDLKEKNLLIFIKHFGKNNNS